MTHKPPTYRERAIATSVNNHSGFRDLIIDLASEIDKLLSVGESPSASEDEQNNETNQHEEN